MGAASTLAAGSIAAKGGALEARIKAASRHSTREIVRDHIGGVHEISGLFGPKVLGRNPSWVKASDYDDLVEDYALRVEERDREMLLRRQEDHFVYELTHECKQREVEGKRLKSEKYATCVELQKHTDLQWVKDLLSILLAGEEKEEHRVG